MEKRVATIVLAKDAPLLLLFRFLAIDFLFNFAFCFQFFFVCVFLDDWIFVSIL